MIDIKTNFQKIQKQIEDECKGLGRDPKEINLVAVTKTLDAEKILQAYNLGHRDFAENYVQEFETKWEALKEYEINWHFIGHLQTNKISKVVGRCVLIHSVDSLKLARKINSKAEKIGRVQDILLQVKVGSEETKTGFEKEALLKVVEALKSLDFIRLRGLMCLLPLGIEDAHAEELFTEVKNLKESICSEHCLSDFDTLSMGMSGDFLFAIRAGSTMIRLGQSLFGERK